MKKTILKGLGALAFAALIVYNINSGTSKTAYSPSLSSFGKKALADCEHTTMLPGDWIVTYKSECQWICTHGGSNPCPL